MTHDNKNNNRREANTKNVVRILRDTEDITITPINSEHIKVAIANREYFNNYTWEIWGYEVFVRKTDVISVSIMTFEDVNPIIHRH